MWTIAKKEFRDYLYNPRYLAAFALGAAVILLSILSGFTAFNSVLAAVAQEEATSRESLAANASFNSIYAGVYRYPDRLTIFDIGVSGLVHRAGAVLARAQSVTVFSTSGKTRIRTFENRYDDDPVLALFGELDLTFTVTYILSLLAVLFSFGAVSGERESGTLRLLLAGSTRRSSVILGKIAGGFLPVALLFLLPFLAGLIGLLILAGISFSGGEWLRIALMAGAVLLYLLVFHVAGVAASALTRTSLASFMISLLFWVLGVAIVPKLAVQLGGLISPSLSTFECDRRVASMNKQLLREMEQARIDYFRKNDITHAEESARDAAIRNELKTNYSLKQAELEDRLRAELLRGRNNLLTLATAISRVSPAGAFQLIAHAASRNGPRLLGDFETSLDRYQIALLQFLGSQRTLLERQSAPAGEPYEVVRGSDGMATLQINYTDEDQPRPDISAMPKYAQQPPNLGDVLAEALPDFFVLAFFALFLFALAWAAFLRYDVR